ncbi:hypothetical protein DICVIV_02295 [Dictyocaulus viviparus]|uniref:Uncharacterized protein n=1 Tax=Dictyocaulus viviparus TaxID=29172 RepID=A0A0D8Y3U9_DICVI|nr:hypothetical protein DICVIV_02295 [Dictyocaulus viviparus]
MAIVTAENESTEVKNDNHEQYGENWREKLKRQIHRSGLVLWMNDHVTMVRCSTAAVTVVGVAGCCILCLAYARRIRYGGFHFNRT